MWKHGVIHIAAVSVKTSNEIGHTCPILIASPFIISPTNVGGLFGANGAEGGGTEAAGGAEG
jgi:hypothetical protein